MAEETVQTRGEISAGNTGQGPKRAAVRVVVCATLNETEAHAYGAYLDQFDRLIDRAGAQIVARERQLGDIETEMTLVIEFPNYDVQKSLFDSADFACARVHREKAFKSYSVHLAH